LWLFISFFAIHLHSQQAPAVPPAQESPSPAAAVAQPAAGAAQQPNPQDPGSISGTVVDSSGAAVPGAHITLHLAGQSATEEATSGSDGQFSFASVAPGPFKLSIAATGMGIKPISGTLSPGEDHAIGTIMLSVATAVTEVRVGPAIAEQQVKEEEQQRVLGVFPNFYVTYINNAVPLDAKQKFELAWRTTLDPITFVLTGAAAGIQQANDDLSGYGQGAAGYGDRFGASYAGAVTSTFIGGAILPSLLKQDPRYFYKGTGSVRSRVLYALATAVICKGDNGHWQADYSGILGSIAAGGISNLYYPAASRGATLVFENTGIQIGESAAADVLQEFVIRRFTRIAGSHKSKKSGAHPANPPAIHAR
jgi:hypothetical protein